MLIRNLLRAGTPLSKINDPNTPLYQAMAGIWDAPPSDAGASVTQQSALRVMAVYACVRLIAETAAALPLKTFSGEGTRRQEVKAEQDRLIWARQKPEKKKKKLWEQAFG